MEHRVLFCPEFVILNFCFSKYMSFQIPPFYTTSHTQRWRKLVTRGCHIWELSEKYCEESGHGALTASSSPTSAEATQLRLRSTFLLGSQSSFCPEFVVSVRICVCWPLRPWNNRLPSRFCGAYVELLNSGVLCGPVWDRPKDLYQV